MIKKKIYNLNSCFLEGKRPYFWIIFVVFLIYGRSLFFEFSYFDDNVLILDNLFFLRRVSNVFKSFTMEVFHILHSSAAYYRPILTVSYIFDALISGSNPFGYHLTGLIIHILVSFSLFYFLLTLGFRKEFSFFFLYGFFSSSGFISSCCMDSGKE